MHARRPFNRRFAISGRRRGSPAPWSRLRSLALLPVVAAALVASGQPPRDDDEEPATTRQRDRNDAAIDHVALVAIGSVDGEGAERLVTVRPGKKRVRTLVQSERGISVVAPSPDGKTIAYIEEGDPTTSPSIFVVPATGRDDPRELLSLADLPQGDEREGASYGMRWTPDAAALFVTVTAIVGEGGGAGAGEHYFVALDGELLNSEPHFSGGPLLPGPGIVDSFWKEDSCEFVIAVIPAGNPPQRLDESSSTPVYDSAYTELGRRSQVLESGACDTPSGGCDCPGPIFSLSPDNEHLLVAGEDFVRVFATEDLGSSGSAVPLGEIVAEDCRTPAWSLDGRRFALPCSPPVELGSAEAEEGQVMVGAAEPDGSFTLEAFATSASSDPPNLSGVSLVEGRWSPKGERFAFLDRDFFLFLVEPTGGSIERATSEGTTRLCCWVGDDRLMFTAGGELWALDALKGDAQELAFSGEPQFAPEPPDNADDLSNVPVSIVTARGSSVAEDDSESDPSAADTSVDPLDPGSSGVGCQAPRGDAAVIFWSSDASSGEVDLLVVRSERGRPAVEHSIRLNPVRFQCSRWTSDASGVAGGIYALDLRTGSLLPLPGLFVDWLS